MTQNTLKQVWESIPHGQRDNLTDKHEVSWKIGDELLKMKWIFRENNNFHQEILQAEWLIFIYVCRLHNLVDFDSLKFISDKQEWDACAIERVQRMAEWYFYSIACYFIAMRYSKRK